MEYNIYMLFFICGMSNLLFYFTLDNTYLNLLLTEGTYMSDTQKYEFFVSLCLVLQLVLFSSYFRDGVRRILAMHNNVAIMPVIYQINLLNIIIGMIVGLRYTNIYITLGIYATIIACQWMG